MSSVLLAAATWEEVVPFIAMAAVPLVTAIGILWKKVSELQDRLVGQAERILPLATQMTAAVTDLSELVVTLQERALTKQQVARLERLLRG